MRPYGGNAWLREWELQPSAKATYMNRIIDSRRPSACKMSSYMKLQACALEVKLRRKSCGVPDLLQHVCHSCHPYPLNNVNSLFDKQTSSNLLSISPRRRQRKLKIRYCFLITSFRPFQISFICRFDWSCPCFESLHLRPTLW